MAPINEGAQMKVHVLGSLQTMSYSTHQDRAPVRSIGNINAIDYVQGQRTIAGTMVFAMFHQHWMTPLLEELADHVSNTDIWSDELPALNLTISMANEYGYKSNMVLYGVKFIDDGGVMSINDLYTENTLQYVATGIQPLRTSGQFEHSYFPTIHPFYISDTTVIPRRIWEFNPDLYTKIWPKFRDIVIDVITTPPTIYPFSLSAIIDPPISFNFFEMDLEDSPHNNYVVSIIPDIFDPRDKITNIFLNKEGDDDSDSLIKQYECIEHPILNKWVAEVPEGYYSVDVETESGDVIEDAWGIVVSDSPNQDGVVVSTPEEGFISVTAKTAPVISAVEDTAVSILSNKPHEFIEVKVVEPTYENQYQDEETGDNKVLDKNKDISVGRNNNKEILIEDLLPNTKYSINTYDPTTGERSDSVTIKTFSHQKYANDLLASFIQNNSNLIVNKELLSLDLSNTKYEYNNILDSLIDLDDSDLKSELLLLSTLLQNKINDTYNDNGIGSNSSYNIQNILNNTYYFNNEVKDVVVYKKSKTKSYYVTKNENNGEFNYNGGNNIHYVIQPNLITNNKTTHVDFVCFNQQQQNILSSYNYTVNIDSLQLINNSYTYNSYNSELMNAIKATENVPLHKNVLEEPHATMYNDTFVIDVDYKEKNLNSESDNLFLCVATPEEAVNKTPIIKTKIKEGTMLLDKYDLLMLKNSYYLMWVQDSDFNNISPPFVLSTYKNDTDIEDYHSNKNRVKLEDMSSLFKSGTSYSTYINTAIDIVLAEPNASYKNIEYYVIQALLLLYEDHLISRTLDDVVNKFVESYYNKGQISCKFIKEGNNISFESSNRNASIACVNITQNEILKNSFENIYDINTYNEGYTLLYLIDNKRNITSNVILINNATKDIFSSNIHLEVIK